MIGVELVVPNSPGRCSFAFGSRRSGLRLVQIADWGQINGEDLPLIVSGDFEIHFLAFHQVRKPGLFDRRHMDKDILLAIGALDKTKALREVKPLNGTTRHSVFFQNSKPPT